MKWPAIYGPRRTLFFIAKKNQKLLFDKLLYNPSAFRTSTLATLKSARQAGSAYISAAIAVPARVPAARSAG